MTYIGLSPPNTFTKSTSQTFTGNGSTTAFTLQTRVASPEDLEVFVSNVQQQPTESYTIGSDGVTMTFSEAPPSGTFYVIYRTVAQQAGTDTGASRLGENNTFTGTNTFNADVTFTGANYNASWDKSEDALKFTDGAELRFGTGDDLTIRHDTSGNNSRIIESGSGSLFIQGENLELRNRFSTKKYIRCIANAEVELYHNNSQKLETTSTGVAVTGNVDMNGGELILDADADTSITADTDDQIDIKVGGTDTAIVTADTVKIRSDNGALVFRRTTSETDIAKIQYVHGNPSLDIGGDGKNVRFINGSSFAETMRVGTNGDITIQDGNLVVANGHGIDFAFTGNGSGSMSSELFNDYEEGTWTPANSGSNITYSQALGHYTKIGRLVTASFDIQVASNSSSDGLHIINLPYPLIGANQYGGGFIHFENTSFTELMIYGHDANFVTAVNGSTTLTGANLSGARLLAMLVYFTS